jgi:hypothetical protein
MCTLIGLRMKPEVIGTIKRSEHTLKFLQIFISRMEAAEPEQGGKVGWG